MKTKDLASLNSTRSGAFKGRIYVPVSGLPSTQAGVSSIQDRVQNLIDSSGEAQYRFFMQKQIENLKNLRAECLATEQALYAILGVNSLEELQDAFNKVLGVEGLGALSNVNTDKLVEEIRVAVGKKMDRLILGILNSDALRARIRADQDLTHDVYQLIGGIIQLEISNAFMKLGTKKTGFQMRMVEGGDFEPISSGNNVRLTIDNYMEMVNGVFVLKEGKSFSPWMRNRVLMAVANMAGSPTVKITKDDMKYILKYTGMKDVQVALGIDIRDKITRMIKGQMGNSLIAPLVIDELERNFEQYALSSNASVVKGFLGEVQFNVFLQRMLPKSSVAGRRAMAQVFATGNMKDMLGRSFGMDSVMRIPGARGMFKQFNFQVKNIKETFNTRGDSTWEYEKRSTMQGLMARAGIPNGGLLDQFYASWSFNTIFPDDPYHAGWPGGYAGTFSRFAGIAANMDKIFLSYADKIMRVDQIFQAQDDEEGLFPFGNYLNVLFMVGNKLVPSSRIVGGMIQSLASVDTSAMINFDILDVQQKNKKGEANLYDVIMTQNAAGYTVSPNDATKNISMKYKITINLSQILSKVAKF